MVGSPNVDPNDVKLIVRQARLAADLRYFSLDLNVGHWSITPLRVCVPSGYRIQYEFLRARR